MKVTVKIVITAALLCGLYFFPHDIMFNGKSICLYKNLFGFECPGCGLTRAAWLLVHLKFYDAFAMNKLIIIVFPMIIFIYGRWMVKR
ncbi:MAG: DUF2752 domain-containing protein [Candidatus Goldbacteria bacterium]|nr:DUF2752 domain-containing protein [Candidatus Goldiibacteriota bacterium]